MTNQVSFWDWWCDADAQLRWSEDGEIQDAAEAAWKFNGEQVAAKYDAEITELYNKIKEGANA